MDIRDAHVANIYAGRDLRGLLGKLTRPFTTEDCYLNSNNTLE